MYGAETVETASKCKYLGGILDEYLDTAGSVLAASAS